MMQADKKTDLIKKFGINSKDTGSSEVQIALFSERIKQIHAHLEKFPKDHHSRKGLVCLVGKRKALLNYLKKNKHNAYTQLVSTLKQAQYL